MICQACSSESIKEILDLGKQYVSHHFLDQKKPESGELSLAVCKSCGLTQLQKRIEQEKLVPRYSWLTCTEPEDHLDQLVETFYQKGFISNESSVGAITFKDDTTLERIEKRGIKNTWRLDPKNDLGIDQLTFSVETVQKYFSEKWPYLTHIEKVDFLIIRHVLEHAFDLPSFIQGLRSLVKPGGRIYFEVPDCERAFQQLDFTTIWEEHLVYFTEMTFKRTLESYGLIVEHFEIAEYPTENSLIAVAEISDKTQETSGFSPSTIRPEIEQVDFFARNFLEKKQQLQSYFVNRKENGKKLALFGAGHMAVAFLNFYQLSEYFDFVVDDNSYLSGLSLPGSNLPVYPSQKLYDENIDECYLTLAPSSETKVVSKHQKFVESNHSFFSIFPQSSRAIPL
jgi:SAM-dependent methyltransferase